MDISRGKGCCFRFRSVEARGFLGWKKLKPPGLTEGKSDFFGVEEGETTGITEEKSDFFFFFWVEEAETARNYRGEISWEGILWG